MNNIENLTKRKQRWISFQDLKSDVDQLLIIRYAPDEEPSILPYPDLWKERLIWSKNKYEKDCRRMEWLDDDTIPHLDMLTGTEIFAEAFGCEVARPENDRPFALPVIKAPEDFDKIKEPELSKSTLAILFEKANELRKMTGSYDAPFRLPDIQSPMDIVALIWDKNDLYISMILYPDLIKQLSKMVYNLQIAFFDEWFSQFGREYIAHFPCYFMNTGISLSEDEIGVVDVDHFNEFFLPELQALSNRYGGLGVHCCADSLHQWENFLKIPDLKMLNLVRPGQQLKDSFHFFAPHVAQYPTIPEPWLENPGLWINEIPKRAHIVIEVMAKDRSQAIDFSNRFRKHI